MTAPSNDELSYPRPNVTELLTAPANRLKVLEAAAEALMEFGYDATSIDDIADRMGATKGAVYYSYRSKLDIFLAVYERGMLLLEERVSTALDEVSSPSPASMLRAVSVAHAVNIMKNYNYHVVIQTGVEQRRHMALKESERIQLGELDNMRTRHEMLVRELIETGQHDGLIRPVDSALATRTLIGGVVGIARWFRPHPGQNEGEQTEIADQVVDILLAGLLPN